MEFSAGEIELDSFIQNCKKLKQKYSKDNLETLFYFWLLYKDKYTLLRDREKKIDSFYKMTEIYTLPLLSRYINYASDLYPSLLPEKYDNYAYYKIIKELVSTANSSNVSIVEMKLYFIKTFSLDIQVALESGYKTREILRYFKIFSKYSFASFFLSYNCHHKQNIALVVSNNLDFKLNWMREKLETFQRIVDEMGEQKESKQILNLLGLYSYASVVRSHMTSIEQKKMFDSIINLPTKSLIFNLSLIYALGNHTAYFSAIINGNNNMYANNKYKQILYVSRDGKTLFDYFNSGDMETFSKETDRLVATSYQDIHDLTTIERIALASDIVDYTSYATMIVPGIGTATQLAKVLTKMSIKGVSKEVLRKIIINGTKIYSNYNYVDDVATNQYISKSISLVRNSKHIIKAMGHLYLYLDRDIKESKLCRQ